MQSATGSDVEENKDSSTRNLYAAHIVRKGLNKAGWKLVVTGASMTVFVAPMPLLRLGFIIKHHSECCASVAWAQLKASCYFNYQVLCRRPSPEAAVSQQFLYQAFC